MCSSDDRIRAVKGCFKLGKRLRGTIRQLGYWRVRAALGSRKVFNSEKVVQRLMKQGCLVVAANRRRRHGSYLGEISPALGNLINRDFQAQTPNEKWLTDITKFHIPSGSVYLSPMIDCFDALVVSGTIGTRPDTDVVNTMLDTVIETVAKMRKQACHPL